MKKRIFNSMLKQKSEINPSTLNNNKAQTELYLFYTLLQQNSLLPSSNITNNIANTIPLQLVNSKQLDEIQKYYNDNYKKDERQINISTFLVDLTQEYFNVIQSILSVWMNYDVNNKSDVVTFLNYLFDSNENNNLDSKTPLSKGLYFKAISNLLLLSKYLHVFSFFLNNELVNLGLSLIRLASIFHQIISIWKKETILGLSKQSLDDALSSIMLYLIDLLSHENNSILLIIIEKEENAFIINDLIHYHSIRKLLYNFFLYSKINFNKTNSCQVSLFYQKHLVSNKILQLLQNAYSRQTNHTLIPILNEIIQLIILSLLYTNDVSGVTNVFSCLKLIFNDCIITESTAYASIISPKIKQLTILVFFNENTLKSNIKTGKIKEMHFESDQLALLGRSNMIIHYNIIHFFYDVYNQISELRNIISLVLIKEFSKNILDYQNLIGKTAFFQTIIQNLHNCNEEVISYYFMMIFTLAEQQNTNYTPVNEISILIFSFHQFNEHFKLMILIGKIKLYIKVNNNNPGIISELSRDLCQELFLIIQALIHKTSNNEKAKDNYYKHITLSQESLIEIARLYETILFKLKVVTNNTLFNYIDIELFFEDLCENYPKFTYRLFSIRVRMELKTQEIAKLIEIIIKRHKYIINNLDKNDGLKELKHLLNALKIFFKIDKEINIEQRKQLHDIISSFPQITFEFLNSKCNNGNSINIAESNLKDYLIIVLKYISFSNSNAIKQQTEISMIITYPLLKNIILSVLEISIKFDNSDTLLLTIIKFIIDFSLFQHSIIEEGNSSKTDSSNIHCSLNKINFAEYYNTKYNINFDLVKNKKSKLKYPIKSTFILQSPLLIILLLKNLIKIDKYTIAYLKLIELVCRSNDNNAKLLTKASLIKKLLKLPLISQEYIPHITSILSHCVLYLSQNDLKVVFVFLLIYIGEKHSIQLTTLINTLISLINSSLSASLKMRRSITLTSFNISQPNTYNFIHASDINLHSDNTISIVVSLTFHVIIDNTSFTLLSLQNEGENPNSFSLLLENSKLIIKENESKASFLNQIMDYIFIDKEALFHININKERNQLTLWINNILFLEHYFQNISFKKINSNPYSLMIGFSDSVIKEIKQQSRKDYIQYPYISLSYALIYLGEVTNDIIKTINLCKISTSKTGSIRCVNKTVPYLSTKNYQYISSVMNRKCLNMDLRLDCEKISYELIVDSLSFIQINKQSDNNNDSVMASNTFSPDSSLIQKVLNRYNIQLSNNSHLEYITTYQNKNKSLFFEEENDCNCNHTYLINIYNQQKSNSFNIHWIFEQYNLKDQFNQHFAFIDTLIDMEVRQFRFSTWIIILLHESENIKDKNSLRVIINNLISLLSSYLVINLPELNQLSQEGSYLDSLFISIYKNAEYINKESIDLVFFLSYAYNGNKKELLNSVHHPMFPDIITEVLLNTKLFDKLSAENKQYLLSLINKHIILNEFTTENYSLSGSLLNRFIHICLLSSNNTNQIVDNTICSMVNSLIDKLLQSRIGFKSPNQYQLNQTINILSSFIIVTERFNVQVRNHIENKLLEEQVYINNFIKNFFKKVYFESDNNEDNMIIRIRDKITSHLKQLNLTEDIYNQIFNNPNKASKTPELQTSYLEVMNENNRIKSKTPHKITSNIGKFDFDTIYNIDVSIENNLVGKQKKEKEMKKSAWTLVDNLENDVLSNNITYDFKDEYICFNDCSLCNFIKNKLKNELSFHNKYINYQTFIKSYHNDLFLTNQFKNDYIHNSLRESFSWSLSPKEGPNRIRNKIISNINAIQNEAIDRTIYKLKDKKCNEYNPIKVLKPNDSFQNKFSFHDVINLFYSIVSFDQIFNFNIIEQFINENDIYEKAFNALMIKGITQTTSVLIMGKNNVYIINHLLLDQNGKLYISQKPLKKYFWTINDYNDILGKECKSLNALNDNYKESLYNKINKFEPEHFSSFTFSYQEINEIHQKGFLHQDISIEIFLNNGSNYFFAFNTNIRDIVWDKLLNKIHNKDIKNKYKNNSLNNFYFWNYNSRDVSNNNSAAIYMKRPKLFLKKRQTKQLENKVVLNTKELVSLFIRKWSQGLISNYGYLMLLNTLSGRSYNDLSIYPVFPWIIKNAKSDNLNLCDESVYRDFSYPIYAQQESNRSFLQMKYNYSDDYYSKYHSGSHYSTSAFTAYFLFRLKPFSEIAAEIQGNYFDTPDRLFYNLKGLGDVAEKYQEFIPELFNLPEAFVNINQYQLGMTQSNECVEKVIMPNWAMNNPRIYIKMNKKAIESPIVSEKISDWIDLIFGYKQNGDQALKYFNILRPVCSQFDPNKILNSNELSKKELDMTTIIDENIGSVYEKIENRLNEISNMGQNPIQLFFKPHSKKEKHQIDKSFYGKHCVNNLFVTKQYDIKLNGHQPKEIKSFNEKAVYYSHGEGGLSSFRRYYEDSHRQDKQKHNKAMDKDIYIIAGSKRVLLPPLYIDYIDYCKNKYSFTIVKPLSKTSFEFATNRTSPIIVIKSLSIKKHFIIGYEDGTVSKYKIIDNTDITSINNNSKESQDMNNIDETKKTCTSNIAHIDCRCFHSNDCLLIKPLIINKGIPDNKEIVIHTKNKFNPKFTQLTKEKSNESISDISILLINSNQILTSRITCIEICECYSMMVIIDSNHLINIFDLNSFELLRQLNYKHFDYSGMAIQSISICPHTGDFALITQYQLSYFNINGVVLAIKNLKEKRSDYGKIGSIILKSNCITASDNYIFTGHDNGLVVLWSIGTSKHINDYIDSYEFAYNRKFHFDIIKQNKENNSELMLQMIFEEVIRVTTQNYSIELMKISENEAKLIVINRNNKLLYIKFKEELTKNKNNPHLKCSYCSLSISSSKIRCHFCHSHICPNCKKEIKIAEYSLQIPIILCDDCKHKYVYSNRELYDY